MFPMNNMPRPGFHEPPAPAPVGGGSENGDDIKEKKPRKRRTLNETGKRDFTCGCGKSYVSYPAIYLHVQRKHGGKWP